MLDINSPFVLDWRNALGLVLSVMVAFISGPGGQGGGSFYIVIFSVLLGFSTNQASALSAAVVFFGCITMVVQAVATSHPQVPRLPVIDYSLVLAMTPSLIIGLALGVLVNALISQWLLNLLIIAIWTWSSIRLCFSYRTARTQEKETQQQQQQQEREQQHKQGGAAASAGPVTFELVICCDPDTTVGQGLSFKAINNRVLSCWTAAVSRLSSWASYQPWWTISASGLLFALFIACQVIQGRLTPMCSASYWAITGLLCGVGLAAAAGVSVWLLRAEARKNRDTQPDDATNTLPTTAVISPPPAAAAAADPAAGQATSCNAAAAQGPVLQPSKQSGSGSVVRWTRGMLAGIHIQMVIAGLMLGAWPLSPIILAIPGMHPQVGAGTSKLMLFMITAGAGLSFIAAGTINMSYLLVYGLINAVATPLGVWLVDWAIKRTGRPSCIIMLTIVRLMACVVLQAALQAVPSLIALAHGLPRAGFMAQPLCQHKH